MECAFAFPVTTECSIFVMCNVVCSCHCFAMRGCAVSRMYTNVCNSAIVMCLVLLICTLTI